jgi:hypothetical protein
MAIPFRMVGFASKDIRSIAFKMRLGRVLRMPIRQAAENMHRGAPIVQKISVPSFLLLGPSAKSRFNVMEYARAIFAQCTQFLSIILPFHTDSNTSGVWGPRPQNLRHGPRPQQHGVNQP